MEKTIKGDVRQTFFRSRQCLKPRLNGIMNVYSRQCRSVLSVCRLGSGCVRIQRRGRTEMARSRMLLLLAGVMPCVVLVEHGWSCSPRCKDVFLLESLHRCVPVRSLFTVCRCHPPCARISYTVEASNFHPLRTSPTIHALHFGCLNCLHVSGCIGPRMLKWSLCLNCPLAGGTSGPTHF
jgi:hypothetical protein